MQINKDGWVYEIEIDSFYPAKAAKLWGLPEDCEPGEAAEVEFDLVSIKPEEGFGADLDDVIDGYKLEALIIEAKENEGEE